MDWEWFFSSLLVDPVNGLVSAELHNAVELTEGDKLDIAELERLASL